MPLVSTLTWLVLLGCQQYGFTPKNGVPEPPSTNGGTTHGEDSVCVPDAEEAPVPLGLTCGPVPFEGFDIEERWRYYADGGTELPIVLPEGDEATVISIQTDATGALSRGLFLEGATGSAEVFGPVGPQYSFQSLCGRMTSDGPVIGVSERTRTRPDAVPSSLEFVALALFRRSNVVAVTPPDTESTLHPGCQWFDVDADGYTEAVNRRGLYRVDPLALAIPYSVPDWLPTRATWYESFDGGFLAVSDTHGECRAEIPTEAGILDTTTGETLYSWRGPDGSRGSLHVFNGAAVRDGSTVLWWGTESSQSYSLWPRHVILADADGGIRWKYEEANLGIPAIGDIDGDGAPELVAVGASGLLAWRLDGTVALTIKEEAADYNPGGSPVLADLDADGRYEILIHSEGGVTIYDGVSGSALARWSDAGTPQYGLVVADVDADGSVDIVGSDWGEPPSIFVLSAANGRFAKGRRVWNQFPYDVTSVAHDGSIIKWPIPSFDATNTFRAQPAFDGHYADLQPVLLGSCVDDWVCSGGDGSMRLSVAATNTGSDDAPPGAELRLYTRKTPDCYQLVATHVIDEAIPSLTSSEPVVLAVPVEDWGNERVLEVWHDSIHDCDIINNRVPLDLDVCAD